MTQPFITLYTPTYKRPRQLAACLASVACQTIASDIEQIVIPDHVGVGVGGMFERLPAYASAVHGDYVHILADDDVLAGPTVVEDVQRFAKAENYPPLILVAAQKGGAIWPWDPPWPPRMGYIDLGCVITRRDIWLEHVTDYKPCYEGDFWHMDALHRAGVPAVWCDLLFMIGAVSHGAPEESCASLR